MNNQNNIIFGLPKNVINSIVSVICYNKKIEKIKLFGSRAKGNFKKGSDIDIALFAKNLDYNDLLKIKNEVSELPLPYTIDILDFKKINNEELKEHILRVGITLFSN
jgi:predicted nucleotidyltransferase